MEIGVSSHNSMPRRYAIPTSFLLFAAFAVISGEPGLQITTSGNTVQVQFTGTLMSSSNVNGPYRRIANPTAPYQVATSADRQFWTELDPASTTLAVGDSHSAALQRDGTLWTWGWNITGQLGNGSSGNTLEDLRLYPENIGSTMMGWKSVSSAGATTAAIADDDSLWMWGSNGHGALADPVVPRSLVPIRVPSDIGWKSVTCSSFTTLGIKRDGSLWAWGHNSSGALGNGNNISISTPQWVQPGTRWKAISFGGGGDSGHCAGIRDDGSLWCWGDNTTGASGLPTGALFYNTPQPVFTNTQWRSVSAGPNSCAGIQTDGTLWAWGRHGYGTNGSTSRTLQPIETNHVWRAVSAGPDYAMALRRDGTLWAWGNNSVGKLGIGSSISSTNELQWVAPDQRWSAVSAGYSHTLALNVDGSLWSWGLNRYGELGIGAPPLIANSPQRVGSGTGW